MSRFGALLKGAFGRPKPDRDVMERGKALDRAARRFSSDTAFAVDEIACTDPACPGIVILVMEPGVNTRACKIPKPLDQVTEQDIVDSLGE